MSRKFTVIKFDDDIFSNDPDWIIDYDKEGRILSEKFMEKYKEILNWVKLCRTQKLSIDFMMKNIDILPLSIILKFQKLNSKFLRYVLKNYKDDINWNVIVKHQSLDSNFIKDYIRYMDISMLISCQDLDNSTKKFVNQFIKYKLIDLDISCPSQEEEFERLLYIHV